MPECPACKKDKGPEHFHGLPLDVRCKDCIPPDTAMAIYDKRVQEAGHTLSKILDANEQGISVKPLERMVSLAYESWGGPNVFMKDVVTWIQELGNNPKTKGVALVNAMKLLNLHAKVDRMRLDEDFKRMDDDTLRESIKLKIMALFAEASNEEAKAKAMKSILGDT